MTPHPEIARIACSSAFLFNVTVEEVFGPTRPHDIVSARFAAIWTARQATKLSTPRLGHFFGRTHCAIQHAIKSASDWRETDKDFRNKTDKLLAMHKPFTI